MDASEAVRNAQAVIRSRRAAAWCAALAALLVAAAIVLGAADAALALGDRVRQAVGWLWLAAAPAGLAALALRWRGLAPQGDAAVRAVEAACGDGQRTLAQALELARRSDQLALAAASQLAARLPLDGVTARLPRSRAPRWLVLTLAGLAIIALTWAMAPRLAGIVFARWSDPLGDHPPWSPTTLVWAGVPDRVRARHAARVEVAAEGRACAAPVLVVRDDGRESRLAMFPVGPQRWAAEVARVERPLLLWAEGGGTRTHRHALAIDPLPELVSLDLRLDQPAYARLPPSERRLRHGEQAQLDALTGASLRLVPTANRPLAAVLLACDAGAWTRLPLVDGAAVLPARPGLWRLRLEAGDGAIGETEEPLRLSPRADQAPRADFAEPSRDAYATPDSIVPFRAVGSDDLGLSAALRAREVNGLPVPTAAAATPTDRTWEWRGALDLTRLGADPGDIIALSAVVRDSDPVVQADGRPGKPSAVALRRVQVVTWDEYNSFLLQRLDGSALEMKYRPLVGELAELQKLRDELKKTMPPGDELDRKLKELEARADALAAKVEAMKRPKPLFRVEPDLQDAIAKAAREFAEGKRPSWDAAALAKDLAELTRRARGADLARRLGQLADAEQNTVERLLPLGGHRRPTDGDLLRLSELGQQEELLAQELGTWRELARAWIERERGNLPRETAEMERLLKMLEDSGAQELKQRSAAAARAGDGREAHRLASEARDRLLGLLPQIGRCGGACAGGACMGMGWSDKFGNDLGGLGLAAGMWGLGGRGSSGMGMWLGYGGDDLGGSLPSASSDLYGPENLGDLGGEHSRDGGDPIGAMAASGSASGLGRAVRKAGNARGSGATRSTLGSEERRLVETYFKTLEAP